MSLGSWLRLLGRGDYINGGSKADHERTLWHPALFKGVPGRQRRAVQQRLDRLRELRNRIAHHEPIFDRNLTEDHELHLDALGWVSAEVRAWIETHSILPEVLQAPLPDPIRFYQDATSFSAFSATSRAASTGHKQGVLSPRSVNQFLMLGQHFTELNFM